MTDTVNESGPMTPDSSNLDEQLSLMFRRVTQLNHRYYRKNLVRTKSHAHFNAQRGQGRVIALLQDQEPLTQRDMSYLLGIRQQSLCETLAKLEKTGYIYRTPSEKDRRMMIIRLTEKGKEVTFDEEPDFQIFGCLNNEEKAHLLNYLSRIADTLHTIIGDSEVDFNLYYSGYRPGPGKVPIIEKDGE